MIPDTLSTVVAFILLVAPGMSFVLLRQKARPPFDQTALEEAVRILLWSLAFDAAAGLVLAALRSALGAPLLSFDELINQGPAAYWRDHYGLVLGTVGLGVVLALLLGAIVSRSLNHPGGRGWATRALRVVDRELRQERGHRTENTSVWRAMFTDWRPAGAITVVTIVKKDGTVLSGPIAGYSSGSDATERDVALRQPIRVARPGDHEQRALDEAWQVVIVPAAEIAEVMVTWPEDQVVS